MVLVSGSSASFIAGQDINGVYTECQVTAVRYGISFFTYGKATNPDKPNQETGIAMHAASGKVSMQAQSDSVSLIADKQVTIASTTSSITLAAKLKLLLNAGGSGIEMGDGNITLFSPGKIEFKSSLKTLAGPMSSSPELPNLPKPDNQKNSIELLFHYDDLQAVPGAPYKVTFEDGTVRQGKLDDKGHAIVTNVPSGEYTVEFGEDPRDWKPPQEEQPDYKKKAIQAQAKALIEKERARREASNQLASADDGEQGQTT